MKNYLKILNIKNLNHDSAITFKSNDEEANENI
jgi:hypothetical protein